MLAHLTLLYFFITATVAALASQPNGFTLLSPFLGGKPIERCPGTFAIKLPVILFLT
jgi:hypothetical protein